MTESDGDRHDLWVFGYGSLMWRPGFPHVETERALLSGYRRAFCIYSTHHRGTPVRPGLVLGLDRGGTCEGMALRVPAGAARAVLEYLRAREQINGVYRELHVPIHLHRARREVTAIAFVVERAHPSYAGDLPLCRQSALIRGACGISGANVDYLANTHRHLLALGIDAPPIRRLVATVGSYFAHAPEQRPGVRPAARALIPAVRAHFVPAPRLAKGERRRFLHRLNSDRAQTADRWRG